MAKAIDTTGMLDPKKWVQLLKLGFLCHAELEAWLLTLGSPCVKYRLGLEVVIHKMAAGRWEFSLMAILGLFR